MFNRNRALAPRGNQLTLARQRLQQQQIPSGAQYGALAGQPAMHPLVQQQQQQYQQYLQSQGVPQGADAGALAGCAPWAQCGGQIPSPFAGIGYDSGPWLQGYSLLGILATPASAAPITLEISCGNTFFHGCGARSFTPEGAILITEIISGFNTENRLCPGSGVDMGFFRTDDCFCPFDFGCFSNLAPLLMTFDPIDTVSPVTPVNMVIVGERLSWFNECWPWMPPFGGLPVPGVGGGLMAPGGGVPPAFPAP